MNPLFLIPIVFLFLGRKKATKSQSRLNDLALTKDDTPGNDANLDDEEDLDELERDTVDTILDTMEPDETAAFVRAEALRNAMILTGSHPIEAEAAALLEYDLRGGDRTSYIQPLQRAIGADPTGYMDDQTEDRAKLIIELANAIKEGNPPALPYNGDLNEFTDLVKAEEVDDNDDDDVLDANDIATVDRLTTAGEKAYNRGDYQTSADCFIEAYKISGNRKTLMSIGTSYLAMGEPEKAVLYYKIYYPFAEGEDRILLKKTIDSLSQATGIPAETTPPRTMFEPNEPEKGLSASQKKTHAKARKAAMAAYRRAMADGQSQVVGAAMWLGTYAKNGGNRPNTIKIMQREMKMPESEWTGVMDKNTVALTFSLTDEYRAWLKGQ